jgi:DNA-binding NarL/FixJ family response regulator
MRVRVLLVEDHPVTRDGVRTGLERDGGAVVVAEAADARTACLLADRMRPTVAVVDLRLRSRDGRQTSHGIDVIRYLRRNQPAVRILVLSQAGPDEVVTAIQAGAHGWLSKAATFEELATREREVLRCLAKGYDNGEIADALGITVRTVNRHLENIRTKVGHRRRSELIRLARNIDG